MTVANLRIVLIVILTFVQIISFAAEDNEFNPNVTTKEFDQINQSLKANALDLSQLQHKLHQVTQIRDQAILCEKQMIYQLDTFKKLSIIGDVKLLSPNEKKEYETLKKQQMQIEKKLAECRLLIFRTNDSIATLKDMVTELSARQALSRQQTISTMVRNLPAIDLQKISVSGAINTIGFQSLVKAEVSYYIFWSVFFVITLALAVYVNKRYLKWFELGQFLYPIVLLLFFLIVTEVEFWNNEQAPHIIRVLRVSLAYFIALPTMRFLLNSKISNSGKKNFFNEYHKILYSRAVYLLTAILIGFISAMIFSPEALQDEFVDLVLVTYLSVLVGLLIYLCWPLITYFKKIQGRPVIAALLEALVTITFISLIGSTWMGYHRLALLQVRGVTLTVVIFSVTWFIFRMVNILCQRLINPGCEPAKTLHNFFNVKSHRRIYEFILIKICIFIIIFYMFISAMMFAWSFTRTQIKEFINRFYQGFLVFDINLNVARIVAAMLIFSLLSLIVRLVVRGITRQYQPQSRKPGQVAIASMVNYSGFATALIVALLIAGVNFTGLAIIAGALSVGVGLGLQDIVKNFVAGVILLLEQSVKPGDRIMVGPTEGHVKKVRIRATQITTMEKSDVMVPNAEFISTQVTNYMFRNPIWRISNVIGISYDSDIRKAEELLLEIANGHSEVLDKEGYTPRVLFRSFDHSHLEFELRSHIYDVNRKNIIISELNFLIAEKFREHHICFAYPQLDIHFKG